VLFLTLLLPDTLLFSALLLLRLTLLGFSLALLLTFLLALLLRGAPLLLFLIGGLGRLLIVLPALFLLPASAAPSLRIGLCARADNCYRRDDQKSREALEKIEFHEPSYTWISDLLGDSELTMAIGIPSRLIEE